MIPLAAADNFLLCYLLFKSFFASFCWSVSRASDSWPGTIRFKRFIDLSQRNGYEGRGQQFSFDLLASNNMRIAYLILSVVLSAAGVLAQQTPITATTEDGRKILVYPDGTWKPVKQTDKESAGGKYDRPTDSKLFVKATRGTFGVWINEEKWKQSAPADEAGSKITFEHKKDDAYAMVISERIQLTMDGLKNAALNNAIGVAPDTKIVFEEKRVVNGKEVLCMKMAGTLKGIAFFYYGYYYGGTEGTLQVVTYTSANLFDEYKGDLEEFLDGTQIGG
jgi:hypothetical protein